MDFRALFAFLLVSVVALFVSVWFDLLPPTPLTPSIEKKWFGNGKPSDPKTTIKPFKINVTEKDLKDLMTRIQNDLTRLTSVGVRPVDNSGFTNGFNLDYLVNDVANYWMKNFNWRKQEQLLNDVMPQFKTQIDGLDVHFAHIKPNAKLSKGKKTLPLLIVHGWPGKCKS